MAFDESQLDLIALGMIPELGPQTVRRLVEHFGRPDRALRASYEKLSEIHAIGPKRASAITAMGGSEQALAILKRISDDGIDVLTEHSPQYPPQLQVLGEDAPVVLFVKGRIAPEDYCSIAMVGSRKYSPYGKAVAEKLSGDLAAMGMTVVSGLARGIDTIAHRAAIEVGGRTIGVLGSGIDVPYPHENRGLMERMSHSGAVVTEFPPGTAPRPENFPRRNRLISALSLGVLVVEAAQKSGSLITASLALEQGREVFAVPGSILSESSGGTNQLIKLGARMVTSAEDVLVELAPLIKGYIKLTQPPEEQMQEAPTLPLSFGEGSPQGEDEAKLWQVLQGEPQHVDDLVRASGLDARRVLALLLQWEVLGSVKQMEGMRFYRKGKYGIHGS